LAASSQQSAACLLCGNKAGTLTVAILGSSTVDADDIDPASCRLEGVAAMPVGQGVSDEATGDGTTDCTCNTLGGDGWADLLLKFPAQEVAATLAQPNVGDTLTLTLTHAGPAQSQSVQPDHADFVLGSDHPTRPAGNL
jgi:hypothetical protein